IGQVLDKIHILPKVRGARQALQELNFIVYKVLEDRRIKEFRTDDLISRLLQALNIGGTKQIIGGNTEVPQDRMGFLR
ncbi:MAG: hypothetical protein WB511_01865, partial [Nitrososphaeraceae archaeon]